VCDTLSKLYKVLFALSFISCYNNNVRRKDMTIAKVCWNWEKDDWEAWIEEKLYGVYDPNKRIENSPTEEYELEVKVHESVVEVL